MPVDKPTVEFGARTETGPVRKVNEDSVGRLVPSTPEDAETFGYLFVVCDGMGGHGGGNVASSTAVNTFLGSYRETASSETVRSALERAVQRANDAVAAGRETKPELAKMGSTLTAVAIVDGAAQVAHIGDSVCYLIRRGEIRKLTNDHSVVGEMVRAGMITEEQALHHPDRSRIKKYLGKPQTVEPDVFGVDLETGDVLVMASDGLTAAGMTSRDVLRLVNNSAPQEACDRLIDTALAAGAPDNTSVQIVRYVGSPRSATAGDHGLGLMNLRASPSVLAVGVFLVLLALAGGYLWGVQSGKGAKPKTPTPPVHKAALDMTRLQYLLGDDKTLTFYGTAGNPPALSGKKGSADFIVLADGSSGVEIWRVTVNTETGKIEDETKLPQTASGGKEQDKKKAGAQSTTHTRRPGQ